MVDWLRDADDRLRVVTSICHGASTSLWACRGEALDPLLGSVPGGPAVVQRLWSNVQPALAEGRIVTREGLTLVPLRAPRKLTGLLVVAGPIPEDKLSRGYLDSLARLLGGQLGRPLEARQPPPAPPPARRGRVPRGQAPSVSREGLLRMFEQARGNLALVADWIGVSRQTIYNRLRGYRIPRPPRGGRA